jgi:hypothetical protein
MNLFGKIMLGILYFTSLVTIIYGGIMERWMEFAGGFFAFFIAVIIDWKFDTLKNWCRGKNG